VKMKDQWLNLNLRARKIWYEGSSIGRANGIVRLVLGWYNQRPSLPLDASST